jgi:hypothetical protein
MKLLCILNLIFTIFLLNNTSVTAQWSQLGTDLDGQASDDIFGRSVAISFDGKRVAVGAIEDNSNSYTGYVQINEWDGTSWNQLGQIIEGAEPFGQAGFSVDLSSNGNRIAIGAPEPFNVNNNKTGQVKIFEWGGTSWNQLGTSIIGINSNDQFGYSISLSSNGNKIAIGATSNSTNGQTSGQVRTYEWNGVNWEQFGDNINGDDSGDSAGFSITLSADGNRMAIGSPFNDENGAQSGKVIIYEWSGMDWNVMGNEIFGESTNDHFGYSVSLSYGGDHIAVGGPSNDAAGANSGHTRVFHWNNSSWVQLGNDIDGENIGDNSGISVSISYNGIRLAIGASSNDGSFPTAGHVRIYEWNDLVWVQLGEDIDGEGEFNQSGFSSSISSDGNRVIIGAPSNSDIGENAGHARIYEGFIITSENHVSTKDKINIKILPNPASNMVQVIIMGLLNYSDYNLELMKTNGKSLEFKPAKEHNIFYLTNYSKGVYQVLLRNNKTGQSVFSGKLIIQ